MLGGARVDAAKYDGTADRLKPLLHTFWWPMIIVCNAHTTLLCWWEKPAPLEGIILNAPASWNGLVHAVVQARRRGVASPDLPTLPHSVYMILRQAIGYNKGGKPGM